MNINLNESQKKEMEKNIDENKENNEELKNPLKKQKKIKEEKIRLLHERENAKQLKKILNKK